MPALQAPEVAHPMALQTAHSPSAWAVLQPRAFRTQPPILNIFRAFSGCSFFFIFSLFFLLYGRQHLTPKFQAHKRPHPTALQTAHSPSAWAMLQPSASRTQPPMRHPTMPVPEVTAANMLSAVVPGTWKVSAPALGPRNDIEDRVPACSSTLSA